MRNWEKMTVEVHLEEEKYPGLVKSIKEDEAWKSLLGRSSKGYFLAANQPSEGPGDYHVCPRM